MNNFARAHNQWLEPPDDDPTCEDGCGDTMEKDINGEWCCFNRYCPTKFSKGTVEYEMAEALVEFMDSSYTYKQRYERMKEKYEQYVKDVEGKS
jgi:hypothetical protein